MNAKPSIQVELLSKPEQLDAVLDLYRKHTKTLGFLPRGAFEEHTRKRQLLVASASDGSCMGYLLYRIARGKASVVHLCVSATYRGKGVGYALIEFLKKETRHLAGIGLYCRRDYEAHDKWPRYGFVAKNTKRGRGEDQAELTYWWLDHNHADLFSMAEDAADEVRLCAVIDANIFFDIHERNTPESEDSKALLQPWLEENVELFLTNEIFNDINRASEETQRRKSRGYVTRHRLLKTDINAVTAAGRELAALMPSSPDLRDESDLRHLAHAIVAEAKCFITRDEELIERAEPLYERYGLSVLHPATLINQLDNLQREQEYRPARLGGTPHRDGLLKAEILSSVSEAFRLRDEKQSDFEKTLNRFLAKPMEYECRVSTTQDGKPFVFSALTKSTSKMTDVVALRLSRESLAPTVARHVLRSLVEAAARKSAAGLCVSESELHISLVAALQELGFRHTDGKWFKLLGGGVLSVGELRSRTDQQLGTTSNSDLRLKTHKVLNEYALHPEVASAAKLEHLFWPAKIQNAPLPTYIVPIQPRWALHFFDEQLASQLLFGLRAELHLGIEGVYYRSSRGPCIAAPGRILWYVSQGEGNEGGMAIKACSRLEEVIIGKAKELFRRFRRLGVYERRDVISAAGGNPDGNVMALRFTLTERFKVPVTLGWLNSHGVKGNFMGPREISPEEFDMIYGEGLPRI